MVWTTTDSWTGRLGGGPFEHVDRLSRGLKRSSEKGRWNTMVVLQDMLVAYL